MYLDLTSLTDEELYSCVSELSTEWERRSLCVKSLVAQVAMACDIPISFFTTKERLTPYPFARWIVYDELRKAGMTYVAIAKLGNRHYTTVITGISILYDIRSVPESYPREIRLYNKFLEYKKFEDEKNSVSKDK